MEIKVRKMERKNMEELYHDSGDSIYEYLIRIIYGC